MSTHEAVWLAAYAHTTSNYPSDKQSVADACLEAFKERFDKPEPFPACAGCQAPLLPEATQNYHIPVLCDSCFVLVAARGPVVAK